MHTVLRAGAASVWLAMGLSPCFAAGRALGRELTGLPDAALCGAGAVAAVVGLRTLLGPSGRGWVAVQVGLIAAHVSVLAVHQPMLLVHPYGMLTKCLPWMALIAVSGRAERQGLDEGCRSWLRAGVGLIWITEGLLPKLLFQQPLELDVVAGSGLVPFDPALFLVLLGLTQIVSGLLVWTARDALLRLVLTAQLGALLVLPVLVAWSDPTLWIHPLAPLAKNLPILVGSGLLLVRPPTAWRFSGFARAMPTS